MAKSGNQRATTMGNGHEESMSGGEKKAKKFNHVLRCKGTVSITRHIKREREKNKTEGKNNGEREEVAKGMEWLLVCVRMGEKLQLAANSFVRDDVIFHWK